MREAMSRERAAVEHFGEYVRPGKYGHRLCRDLYALPNRKPSFRFSRDMFTDRFWAESAWAYEDEDHTRHSDEYCLRQRADALENFDLNMAFFAQIPQDSFEEALTELRRKNKSLRPIVDLHSLAGADGVYMMVMDEYRQAYIGQSSDIRARIKAHWFGTKQFDRLLWGNKHESVLSIDSFRALDNTRIFVSRTIRADYLESKLVNTFPPDYLLNRIGGGKPSGLRGLFIEAEIKRRHLEPCAGLPSPEC